MPRPRPADWSTRLQLVGLAIVLVLAAWWQMGTRPADVPDSPAGAGVAPAPVTAPTPPVVEAPTEVESYDLDRDERRGGHTISRHIGRTDEQLRERLAREQGISAASTYTDLATAERTVARTLTHHAVRLRAWLARTGNRPNLALDYEGPSSEVVGRTLQRGRRSAAPSHNAVVVLRADGRDGFYVLTSYPEAR